MSTELPSTVKIATVWLLLGATAFVAIQWWQREQARTEFHVAGDAIEIQRGADGHYHWPGRVDGRQVDFLIDTGATGTAISAALARQLGLQSIGHVQSSTAGGLVNGDVVQADVALQGGVEARRLRVVALPGLDEEALLGMDILGRLRLEQHGRVMRIHLRPAAGDADAASSPR